MCFFGVFLVVMKKLQEDSIPSSITLVLCIRHSHIKHMGALVIANLSGHISRNTSVPRRSLEHLVSRRELRCPKECDGQIKPEDSWTSTGRLNRVIWIPDAGQSIHDCRTFQITEMYIFDQTIPVSKPIPICCCQIGTGKDWQMWHSWNTANNGSPTQTSSFYCVRCSTFKGDRQAEKSMRRKYKRDLKWFAFSLALNDRYGNRT